MTQQKAYFRYWGKAQKHDINAATGKAYHLLVYHSLDVAAVAKVLLNNHHFFRKRLAYLMGLPEQVALDWCVCLLGIHDLGKFSESFQQLRPDLRTALWPEHPISLTRTIRHDSLGNNLWQQVLGAYFGDQQPALDDFIQDTMCYWLNPVFGHHGKPPQHAQARLNHYFTPFDIESSQLFFDDWLELVEPDIECLVALSQSPAWKKQQVNVSWVLAGIAVLCDWLGSDQRYFTYRDRGQDQDQPMVLKDYWETIALPAAEQAIDAVGILPKRSAPHLELGGLFPFIKKATPLQAVCQQLAIKDTAQLWILEDVTGSGKTEAALIVAQHMLAQGLAGGLYVGLPTMATANAMYERMAESYHRLYAPDEKPSLILSHSARHLLKRFQTSLLAAKKEHDNYGTERNIVAQCNQWLADNRKKALLADVGIGTIDQALLGSMPARHQSLRLLGLLGKILILDEVHAYDDYTSEIMRNLIRFHSAFGGSTLLLSATLTRKQREAFISAFHGEKYTNSVRTKKTGYPLLTIVAGESAPTEQPLETRESVRRRVSVDFCHEDKAVFSLIEEKVQQGQCVCWVRNTVQDAMDAWQALQEKGGIDASRLHLFHSRFALSGRVRIENEMLSFFGKDSKPLQRQGRVLIATQVVEQSLDLDFDFMISDLAPIDLLIQRAGRLQRHVRDTQGNRLVHDNAQDQRDKPVLMLLSPEWTDTPPADWYKALFPKANSVYPHTLLLWKTTQYLIKNGGWTMPEDARNMLEFVYDDGSEPIPAGLANTTQIAIGEDNAKRDQGSFSALSLLKGYQDGSKWDEEARIVTRLGDESQTVYLARWQAGLLSPWVLEERYPWDLSSLRVSQRQLEKLAPLDDPALAKAIQQLREEEKLFDELSVIFPLSLNQQMEWEGFGINQKQTVLRWVYDEHCGFMCGG